MLPAIEALESRLLMAIDTSGFGLYTPTGAPAALTKQPVWLVIHGLTSSKDDPDIQAIANAVQAAVPSYQVLIVNWEALASAGANPNNPQAIANARAVADAICAKIKAARLPASRVNLIGFSMGGQIEDRLAKDLHGVNRLIAVDPAAPGIGINDRGTTIRPIPNFAGYSQYSLAFSTKSAYAYFGAALTADDTVFLTGLSRDNLQRHAQSVTVFITMMRRDAGLMPFGNDKISPLFSIQNVLAGTMPPWRKNTFAEGFEAVMACDMVPGTAPDPWQADFEPVELSYLSYRHHVRHVFAR